MDQPYKYQTWLTNKIREKQKTRKILWIVDIAGNTGKSIFSDIVVEDPRNNTIMLSLDYYRSFKYSSASLIKDYIEKRGEAPSAIIIDAPRDEETKFLHEVYGALEEINNGRIFATFQGKTIQERIPRGIPIIVFSNSPPVTAALSEDRWDIKALYRTVDNKDVYVQDAEVSSNVHNALNNTITWQNCISTKPVEPKEDTPSDKLLFDMYMSNYAEMEQEKRDGTGQDRVPGIIKHWGSRLTTPTSKAPPYVQHQAQKLLENLYRKKK